MPLVFIIALCYIQGMDENKRREQLRALCTELDESKKEIAYSLIEEIIFTEGQMAVMKNYPFIRVNKSNPEIQKATPASKMYHERVNEYMSLLNSLNRLFPKAKKNNKEKSPLREYLDSMKMEVR